jgi:hypothetical protein
MSSRRAFLEASAAALLCGRTMGLQSEIPPPLPAVRLLFAGDAMLARHVGQLARARRNPVWPWRQVGAQFTAVGIACVNLESPFSDRPRRRGSAWRSDPRARRYALRISRLHLPINPAATNATRTRARPSTREPNWWAPPARPARGRDLSRRRDLPLAGQFHLRPVPTRRDAAQPGGRSGLSRQAPGASAAARNPDSRDCARFLFIKTDSGGGTSSV